MQPRWVEYILESMSLLNFNSSLFFFALILGVKVHSAILSDSYFSNCFSRFIDL